MSHEVDEFLATAAQADRCVWLDGGGSREWSGRRSVLAWCESDDVSLSYSALTREVTRHVGGTAEVIGDDIFAALAAEVVDGRPEDQWFGYFGYACRPDLTARASCDLPDAVWMRPSQIRIREASPVPDVTLARESGRLSADGYADAFAAIQHHLRAGDSYEVNLTERHTISSDVEPARAYARLRLLNPAPYAGYLQHRVDGATAYLLSSSPERFARVTAERIVETKPIKGTTPRRGDPADDATERERLRSDQRFRAENLMIVDLLRNDVGMVCEPGTVVVPQLMQVESYATVHQLVSTVRGRLRDGVTTLDALEALFPAGSMTGAPKRRTMEIIDAVESTPRGAYAGAFGWLSGDGRADLGVIIRTLTSTGDGVYHYGTGGGITVHSDAASEYAESQLKGERLRAVFDETGD